MTAIRDPRCQRASRPAIRAAGEREEQRRAADRIEDRLVHADAGYTGAQNRVERKGLRWEIAAKRGRIKAMKDGREKRAIEKKLRPPTGN